MYSVELDDVEVLGIKIICAMRSDRLTMFNCAECNDALKEKFNCAGKDVEKSVFFDENLGTFFACPARFISLSVQSFIEKYDHYEKYQGSSPQYEESNPRFWEAVKVYETAMRDLEDGKTGSSEKENMLKMRNST